MNICAFTAVCEEDRDWLRQYIWEAERLEMPFVILLDRFSSRPKILNHRLCVRVLERHGGEFTEQAKQPLLDAVQQLGYSWALAWDVDETYERDFSWKSRNLMGLDVDAIDTRWLNLWGDVHYVRVDREFCKGHRVKFFNLHNRKWVFDHPITNGPKLAGRKAKVSNATTALTCLHHGMMTAELRRLHKDRWDRIYSTALRGDPNPYNFWREMVETEDEAVTVRHGYT
jgi:hypothetical protein